MQGNDVTSTKAPVKVRQDDGCDSVIVVSTVSEEVRRSMSYVGIGSQSVIGRVAVKVPTNDPPFSGPPKMSVPNVPLTLKTSAEAKQLNATRHPGRISARNGYLNWPNISFSSGK
jgi:hypothetical protein